MVVGEERLQVRSLRDQQQQHKSSLLLGSGRKIKAIRECIGNLNEDIDVIIRQGLCLADEITECVAMSPTTSGLGNAKKGNGVVGFPAIERGLKARKRLGGFRSKKTFFEPQHRQQRSPLTDLSNHLCVSPSREERLGTMIQKHESRARDEAARVIQRHYRAHLRERLQSALVIQAHTRTYLCSARMKVLKAERHWQDVQREGARVLLRHWRKRAFSRNRLREITARREEKYGARSHYHLGSRFNGELIKPEEGAFVMAKKYQVWRMKALAYLKWSKFAATS